MHPYLLHSGHLLLPTYGVLAALGLMAALTLSLRTAATVGLPMDKLPAELGTVEVPAHIPGRHRRLRAHGRLELPSVNDDLGVRAMAERSGVVDVQMCLHDVAN